METTTKKDVQTESKVALVKAEINKQLGDAETLKSLLDTTFKGMEAPVAKRALLEGMLRGFSFTEFLNKDVYAIAYGNTYSLVTSIDRSRKIGAKSGIVGIEEPVYTYDEDGKTIRSCLVIVKKRFADGYIGEFKAAPLFREYSTGKNLWVSKPHTMIAKVAEMHALRKACPEELAQAYVEEEIRPEPREATIVIEADLGEQERLLRMAQSLEGLNYTWADMPGDAKVKLKPVYDEMKAIIESAGNPTEA